MQSTENKELNIAQRACLTDKQQLAIVMTFNQGMKSGMAFGSLFDRFSESAVNKDEKSAWTDARSALGSQSGSVGSILINTGFFGPDINMMFSVLESHEHAFIAATDFLSAVCARNNPRHSALHKD